MECDVGQLRFEVCQVANEQVPPANPLERAVWGESVLGLREGLDATRRGLLLGAGEGGLYTGHQQMQTGESVRALHTGGVEVDEERRLCFGGLQRRRNLHNLQLLPIWKHCRKSTLLEQ